MENRVEMLIGIEKDLGKTANHMRPMWLGLWLSPAMVEQLRCLLKTAAEVTAMARHCLQREELLHLRTSLKEVSSGEVD